MTETDSVRWVSRDSLGDGEPGSRVIAPWSVRPMVAEPGSRDYIGPTKPDPDNPGRRVPLPDPAHEQWYRAVGDCAAGKILPEARRQMQEALKNAPKTTRAPIADGALQRRDDPRRMGWLTSR